VNGVPTRNRNGAEIIGNAVPRTTLSQQISGATDNLNLPPLGDMQAAGRSAAEQMRKRARAGSLKVDLAPGATSTRANLTPRGLVGR
jgi:hypothetical protein